MCNEATRTPLIVALTFAAAAAASCVRVEADVSEAEVTQQSVDFQGIPGGSQAGEVSTTQTFTLSADNLSWAKDLNAEVFATGAKFDAVGEVQDLSFIHYAHITMSDATEDSTTPAVEIVDYERPADAKASSVLDAKTTYPIEVTKVWAAKKVVITMNLAGVFPEETWFANVTLYLSGKITYKY